MALSITAAFGAPQNVVSLFDAVPVDATHVVHNAATPTTVHAVRTAPSVVRTVSHASPALVRTVPVAHATPTVVRTVPVAAATPVATPTVVRTVPVAATPVEVRAEPVDPHPAYQFGYSVADTKTGDAKERQEVRDGDRVEGFYTVADADGRLRRVTYTADSVNGFQATVTYDGEAGPPAIASFNSPAPAAAVVAGTPAQTVVAASPAPANSVVSVGRLAAAQPLVSHVGHATPAVVRADATHVLHNAAVPTVSHAVHAPLAAQPATFVRNADGTLTQVNTNSVFASTPFGIRAVALNQPILRTVPAAATHLVHA